MSIPDNFIPAFEVGSLDYARGKQMRQNAFKEGTEQHTYWLLGWKKELKDRLHVPVVHEDVKNR